MRDTFGRKVLTSAHRAAGKVFSTEDNVKARTEHQKAQDAFNANRERLKAERLAREAGKATPVAED